MTPESDLFRAFVELIGTRTSEARISFHAAPQEDVLSLALKVARKSDVRFVSVLSGFELESRQIPPRRRGAE
jgi:hypothetical protein